MTFEQMVARLTPFQRQYIAAALDDTADEIARACPFTTPESYDGEDLADETLAQIIADCVAFTTANAADLEGLDPREAGADFWTSRNGHDAGFCDRGLGERGERLHVAAKAFGEVSFIQSADHLVRVG